MTRNARTREQSWRTQGLQSVENLRFENSRLCGVNARSRANHIALCDSAHTLRSGRANVSPSRKPRFNNELAQLLMNHDFSDRSLLSTSPREKVAMQLSSAVLPLPH